MAAKLEQPLSPSISRMIRLLTSSESEGIDKKTVIQTEEEILFMLNFELTMASPLLFLDRFMRLGDL
jgi:hypothetical protein